MTQLRSYFVFGGDSHAAGIESATTRKGGVTNRAGLNLAVQRRETQVNDAHQ